ncbi:MAG: hypothetical protein H0X46_03865 [Bacteroidetes bacterium]|nr:hypothetical protein [Bacteroidota bacterium]
MKQLKYLAATLILAAIVLSACVKEKDFPTTPVIIFKKYDSYTTDSADCVITFKDGDGDIGVLEDDSASPNDFRLKYLYKDTTDGVFKHLDDPATVAADTLFISYRVPNLTPEGQYKALDGEIRAKLRGLIYFPTHPIVKFEVTLYDRAGHRSNVVTTDEIVVP